MAGSLYQTIPVVHVQEPSQDKHTENRHRSTRGRRKQKIFLFSFTKECRGQPIPHYLLDMVQPMAKQLQLRTPETQRFAPHPDPTLEVMIEQDLATFMTQWSQRFKNRLATFAKGSRVQVRMEAFVTTHNLQHLTVLQQQKTHMLGEHLRIIRGYMVYVRKLVTKVNRTEHK
jgi:hypothetical protein